MDEDERTVEITIQLDRPFVFVFLLAIIVLQSGYIGYKTFFPERKVRESEIDFELEEPETSEGLREDLLSVGCQHVVLLEVDDMQGKHLEVRYSEALRLAREAAFVGVNEDIMGFILYLDGEYYIWFVS